MFSYYRRFIHHFADIADPLYCMTKKFKNNKKDGKSQIIPTPEAQAAFELLKTAITTEPVMLTFPHWDLPFEVHTDACGAGLGAILCQIIDGQERVVACASRSMNESERKYESYEKECLAAVWAIRLWHHYLQHQKFKLVTDCKAIEWLESKPTSTRIGSKWLLSLQQYTYEIVHRSGTKHTNVDPLSRYFLKSTAPYGEDQIELLYPAIKNSPLFDRDQAKSEQAAPSPTPESSWSRGHKF